jgi:hypothetical protein
MALWSLFVEVGSRLRYSAQITAPTPRAAIRRFLTGRGLISHDLARLSKAGWPASFSMRDVILLIPMDGLSNMYLCQIGRDGKYVSVVMVRTVARQSAS